MLIILINYVILDFEQFELNRSFQKQSHWLRYSQITYYGKRFHIGKIYYILPLKIIYYIYPLYFSTFLN